MIGDLLLALDVGVAAGRDARQQARRGEGVVDAEAVGGSAAPRQGIPGVLAWRRRGSGATRRSSLMPSRRAKCSAHTKRGSGFVRQRHPGVEVANEEERFRDARFGRRQQGIPESRLGRAFGFLGAGNGGENVDHAEAEALLGQIDIQPANRVLRRSGGGAFAAQRSSREHADAVVDARGTAGDDVRPAIGARRPGGAPCRAARGIR